MTSVAEAKQEEIPDSHFGGCPQCGKSDCVRNIGRDHWFCCDEHKTKWCVGSNLFSGWREENEKIWDKNSALLANYTQVQPIRSWPAEHTTHESEERALNAQLQGALAYENGFEEPIANLIADAFKSDSIFLKRAAVAAMNSVGAIPSDRYQLFAALVGNKRIGRVGGVDEDDARVVLARALAEKRLWVAGTNGFKLDADDFDLRDPTDAETKMWEAAYTVPPNESLPFLEEDTGLSLRMAP